MSGILLGLGWQEVLLGFGLFVLTLLISLLVVGFLLIVLPSTYFLDSHDRNLWVDRHPVVRWTGIVLKNLLGIGLIVLGILLSLPGVPGQGLLTVLVGVTLLDVPGKRRFERKLLSRPVVMRNVNRVRERFGREPLQLEEGEAPEEVNQDEAGEAGVAEN